MNREAGKFRKAGIHELQSILRLVDSLAESLYGENLNFVLEWATDGTEPNENYSAELIIWFLDGLGLNGRAEAQ